LVYSPARVRAIRSRGRLLFGMCSVAMRLCVGIPCNSLEKPLTTGCARIGLGRPIKLAKMQW
jgi:hypothetical protein